jgi:hypothetical protein
MSMIFIPDTGSVAMGPRVKLRGIEIGSADSPYELLAFNNCIYSADLTLGSLTINLPEVTSVNDRNYFYLLIEGISEGATVTLIPNGTNVIDGVPVLVLDNIKYELKVVAHNAGNPHWDVSYIPRETIAAGGGLDNLDGGEIV